MDSEHHPRIVGITGTIGSGKSTVGAVLAELGVPVIDTDKIVHDLLGQDNSTRKAVVERFGAAIQQSNGAIDRAALGALVFHDEQARKDLERIVHPAVILECRKRIADVGTKPLVAVLVPLLFEAGLGNEYDEVWTVVTQEPVLRERLRQRDGFNDEQIAQRLAAQWSQERKAKSAQTVIDNSGTREETKRQVKTLLQKLCVLVIAALIWAQSCVLAAAPKLHGWKFTQESALYGAVEVLCTAEHVRIDMQRNDMVIVASAPKWGVIAYSPRQHTYCKLNAATMQPLAQTILSTFSGQILSIAPVKPIKEGLEIGLPSVLLVSPDSYAKQQALRNRSHEMDGSGPARVTLFVLKDSSIPLIAGQIIARNYGIPCGPGIPLRCYYTAVNSNVKKMMRTVIARRNSEIDANMFQIPPGLKQVSQ
ncbi:MAG: dephospho-CoA kinase, partial [Terriglobales bacterium]